MHPTEEQTKTTFFYERLRAVSQGIIETAQTTFLLLIAVRWFDAGPNYKSLLAGAGSFGFVLAPFAVFFAAHSGMGITRLSSLIFIFAALNYFLTAISSNIHVFVFASVIANLSIAMCIPFIIQMYQENYPNKRRGELLSGSIVIRIAVAMLFSAAAGEALNGRLQYYQVLMAIFALAAGFAAFCIGKCPGKNIKVKSKNNPLHALGYIKGDKVFRNTLVGWMLMGFANLMMVAVRVEFLANPMYGLDLTVAQIALLVGVIPNAARYLLSPVWGKLFDRANFFALRIILNISFTVAIITFFTSDSFSGLIFGAVIFGISNAGGDIAWSLWVTKFAPAERVADYMAVHSFFTGIRGIFAPFAAFQLILFMSPQDLALVSALLILLASAILVPEYYGERRRRKKIASQGFEVT